MFETSWRRYGVRIKSWVGDMDQEAVSPMVGARNDASLVSRTQSGDETAWTAIVELHWKRVWSLSRIIVRDQQGAEEVAQETFRVARERLGASGGDAALCQWIQAVCRERALDELRRRGRQPRQATAEERPVERPEVERALAGLDPEDREALLMTEAGSTPEDLATVLAVPATTIRSRCARARAGLLDELQREGAP
jgi:RNA polymerase sigma-70 factor (ECF subfamily)